MDGENILLIARFLAFLPFIEITPLLFDRANKSDPLFTFYYRTIEMQLACRATSMARRTKTI